MISDVLYQALLDLRHYRECFPAVYIHLTEPLNRLMADMEAIQRDLDRGDGPAADLAACARCNMVIEPLYRVGDGRIVEGVKIPGLLCARCSREVRDA